MPVRARAGSLHRPTRGIDVRPRQIPHDETPPGQGAGLVEQGRDRLDRRGPGPGLSPGLGQPVHGRPGTVAFRFRDPSAQSLPLLVGPIPGSRSRARVEENTAAADLQLTEGDLAAVKEILPAGGFGARYATDLPEWV